MIYLLIDLNVNYSYNITSLSTTPTMFNSMSFYILRTFGFYPFELKNNIPRFSKYYHRWSIYIFLLYTSLVSVRIWIYTINYLPIANQKGYIYNVSLKFEPVLNYFYTYTLFRIVFFKKSLHKLLKSSKMLCNFPKNRRNCSNKILIITILMTINLYSTTYVANKMEIITIMDCIDYGSSLVESTFVILSIMNFSLWFVALLNEIKRIQIEILDNENLMIFGNKGKRIWKIIDDYYVIIKISRSLQTMYTFNWIYIVDHTVFDIIISYKAIQWITIKDIFEGNIVAMESLHSAIWSLYYLPQIILLIHLNEMLRTEVRIFIIDSFAFKIKLFILFILDKKI